MDKMHTLRFELKIKSVEVVHLHGQLHAVAINSIVLIGHSALRDISSRITSINKVVAVSLLLLLV